MAAARTHAGTVIALVATGIIVASAGGWLTGRWSWTVAAGALAQIAFAAGTALARGKTEQVPQSDVHVSVADASVTAGNDAYFAGRDLHRTNINNVTKRPAALASGAVLLGSLILAVGGTAYWGSQPGGRFYAAPSLHATAPGKDSPESPATRRSPSHAEPSAGTSSSGAPQGTWNTAATFHEKDSGGDSITQSILFGAPRPLSQLPAVAAAYEDTYGECEWAAMDPPARDLAIPFRIISTLNSKVQVQANVEMEAIDFISSSGSDTGLLADPTADSAFDVLGAYPEGVSCDVTGVSPPEEGPAPVLSQPGDPVTFDGWLIFSNAVSASYPDGNTSALGQTYVYLNLDSGATGMDLDSGGTGMDDIQATGPGVCNPSSSQEFASPLLHIGGPVTSGEGCTGSFSGPAGA